MIAIKLPVLRRRAMALFPFVFFKDYKDKSDPVLVNHERIHLAQQIELLILPFYLIYLVNYLYNLIDTGDHEKAYRNIIFEKEAYQREQDTGYLAKRKKYNYFFYL
ncbi:MAG TPA: hypothetical protein VFW78_03030 [Bacteroidia bacterium]|nr:hypothetical protein [Bacteroidia bacterium]